MLDKLIAMLDAPQQPVVKKLKYDEIKARGGAERIRGILGEEGTPLTPEQQTQVQALFDSQSQAIRQYAEQLVTEEISKLSADDLKPPAPDPKSQQNRNVNPNNVNQNPRAQQIVSKLLPMVSVRRAALERATIDTVMKVLTPAQVASYKLNTL
jgi:hypothetical protein